MGRLLALLAILVLAISGEAAANTLVGRWDAADEGVTVTFRVDGTLAIETKDGAQEGTWTAEADKLVMSLKPPGATETLSIACLYALDGDSLTIRPGDAKCGESTFRRAN